METGIEDEYEEEEDEDEDEVEEGIEIETEFFSNSYVFDPIISEDGPVAFDVQGSLGKNSFPILFFKFTIQRKNYVNLLSF